MFSQLTRYASEPDIPIEDAEMDLRLSYDTRGKLPLDGMSPDAQAVTYVFDIRSPAPPEQVREMLRRIERGCHTTNTIRNPTPVMGRLIHNGVELPLER